MRRDLLEAQIGATLQGPRRLARVTGVGISDLRREEVHSLCLLLFVGRIVGRYYRLLCRRVLLGRRECRLRVL